MDGQVIDPWHLAAVLEGLRLRMDHALRIIDRGMILDGGPGALRIVAKSDRREAGISVRSARGRCWKADPAFSAPPPCRTRPQRSECCAGKVKPLEQTDFIGRRAVA